MIRTLTALCVTLCVLAGFLSPVQGAIVINEIHYNPEVKTEQVEFVELFNSGATPVNLGGWRFTDGIDYQFPAGTVVTQGGFAVVAKNPAALAAKYGYASAFGPYTNGLSAHGEKITLRDAAGGVQDEVNYGAGFPWPTVGDAPGYSIELINPGLDNDLGGSWRASVKDVGSLGNTLIESNSTWKYFKGRTEASSPTTAWRQLNFNDAGWSSGVAPIGYGETFIITPLSDMRSNYTSVFFRKTFFVPDAAAVSNLVLQALYDDGFKVWINGTNVLNANISSGEVAYNGTATTTREDSTYATFNLNNPRAYLVTGTNIIAVQAHNTSISGSTDFFLDMRLRAQTTPTAWGPTPGRTNSVFATNAPPQTRQIEHTPEQPRSGQPVLITAKVTDPEGVASVTLQYQVVMPGQYIELTDLAYTTNWVTLAMKDDGTGGDLIAGDSVFSATIPSLVQQHRRLIRYRITVTDSIGASVRVPYPDDPQPNFAYFVYDGAPAWSGAVQPGAGGSNGVVFTVNSNAMNRLATYHLIGKSNTIATATWFSRYVGDLYSWQGTLVYDGKVYDNVHFRARGGVWRYAMVKNSWKFDFNRGHEFEVRDNWGQKYKTKRKKLDLRASIQQADFLHRGEHGMFEALGYRLFQLADALAPNTTFVTLRVVDDAQQTSSSQFESDFWGVYLAVEEQDGSFLDQHDLPDSNLYKMDLENGVPPAALNNLGPDGPTDKSDVDYIVRNYSNPSEQWWRTNWNFTSYYNWQTIVEAFNDFDINAGKNYFYYFDPRTRLWSPMSWDLDLSWFNWPYGTPHKLASGILQATTVTDTNVGTSLLQLNGTWPEVEREFKNRVREIRDLLFNTNETWRLIDEYAALLQGPTNAPTILDADRAQWDYNPKMADYSYTTAIQKAGQGQFYKFPNESATNAALKGSFASAVQIMKHYVGIRSAYLDALSADAIPDTPLITYVGAANYPINRLAFRSSAFSSAAATNQFGSIEWRIAEVSTNAPSSLATEPLKYEIENPWQMTNTGPILDLTVPTAAVRVGKTYRARVRMWDATGHASHWSEPVQFSVAEPDDKADLLSYLRITEIMYNPPLNGYEYVELHNMSDTVTLDLTGVKFTQGIDFTFPAGATLAPRGYLLVTKAPATGNFAAFRNFYGLDANVPVFGPFSGSLDNAGEQLTLRTSAGGTDIASFHYNDSRGWPQSADGEGHSLVILETGEMLETTGAGEYGGNWRSSTYIKGSPGRADVTLPRSILINEIAANTTYNDPLQPQYDSNDWIELFNATDADITLGAGWYLTDDGAALTKWAIPAGTLIPAHGFVSFDEVTGFHNPVATGFGLNSDGEQVFLSYLPGTAEDRIVDVIIFKAQDRGVSLGRYPDGGSYWFALAPTRDGTNTAPQAHVVLNEVQFHPPDIGGTNDNALDEFIEVFNPTATSVALFNSNGCWRLNGEVTFDFPTNVSLAPNGFLLLVNFNPATNAAQLTAFRSLYGISNGLPIFGPYSNGKLPNSSARLALEQPVASSTAGVTGVWSIVDEVLYADQYPWSCGADGTGSSLQRVNATGHGSDPSNWIAAQPTPGALLAVMPPNAPAIVLQPQSRTVITNSDVTFFVIICGTPPFSCQWLFNGTKLNGATNATLTLRSVQLTDSGAYSLVVSNAGGLIVSDIATLNVQLPPTIVTQPESHSGLAYESTIFSVEPGGTPPFQYQWRFNGVNIPGATNQTLLLTNLQLSDAGSYSVRVANTAGAIVSSAGVLVVNWPAQIIASPMDVITTNHDTVTFTVGVLGSVPLSYQWRFQGVDIPGATDATLTLLNVGPANVGSYSVRVSNAYGSTVSAAATLSVESSPFIVTQPQSHIASMNGATSFTVTAGGTPPLQYQWQFNGVDIADATNQTLMLTYLQFSDEGTYKVRVMNNVGSVVSRGALLSLGEPVRIVAQPQDITTNAGAIAAFSVVANGSAPLVYEWRFNGVDIPGANSTTLALSNVVLEQSGIYSVSVSNPYGSEVSTQATLVVAVKPIVVEQPHSLTLAVGDTAVISVGLYGSQPMGERWFRNGAIFRPYQTSFTNLVLTNLSLTNAGQYRASITNGTGSTAITSNAYLIVVQPPTNQWVQPGTNVLMRAVLSAYAVTPLTVAWEHNGVILHSTNHGMGNLVVTNDLVLNSVSAYDSGVYNLIVTNSTAFGSNSSAMFSTAFPMNLNVSYTEPPSILEPPISQTVKAGSNVTFSVVASGPGPLSYQWWFNQTNRIAGATNASLVLSNVNGANEGAYQVAVSNSGGSVFSPVATLKVFYEASAQPQPVKLAALLSLELDAVLIRFNVLSNTTYTLESAAQCEGPWSSVLNVPAAPSNYTITVTNALSGSPGRHFFRVVTP